MSGQINTNLFPFSKYIQNWRKKRFPQVQRPKVMGAFSVDSGEFLNSLQNLKYLHLPETWENGDITWNLNDGIETFEKAEKIPDNKGKLEHLLRFIVSHPERMRPSGFLKNPSGKVIFPDFVCSSRMLVELMCTPYQSKKQFSGWTIVATKYRGTVYLYQIPKKQNKGDAIYQNCKSKYKQLMTTSNFSVAPDLEGPAKKSPFYAVSQSQFGPHQMLYAHSVDTIQSDVPIVEQADLYNSKSLKYIGLKIRIIEREELKKGRYYYTIKYAWSKNFLGGVERIYMGKRSRAGILEAIEAIDVKDLPEISMREFNRELSPSVCMGFCLDFLNIVKSVMKNIDDDPETVVKFIFNPRVVGQIQYQVNLGKSEDSFLPSWYQDFIEGFSAAGGNVPEECEEVQ